MAAVGVTSLVVDGAPDGVAANGSAVGVWVVGAGDENDVGVGLVHGAAAAPDVAVGNGVGLDQGVLVGFGVGEGHGVDVFTGVGVGYRYGVAVGAGVGVASSLLTTRRV